MKLSVLTPEHVEKEWALLSELLVRADDHACERYTTDDLLKSIMQKDSIVVIAWEPEEHRLFAAFVAQIDAYPRSKVFHLLHAAGVEMERWIVLFPEMKMLAKEMGCDQIQVTGRAGWGRVLKDHLAECGRVFVGYV